MLEEHRLKVDVLSLFHFIQHAIEGREYAKLGFTHTLSNVLELLVELGVDYGLTREDISYVNIQRVIATYSSTDDLGNVIKLTQNLQIKYRKRP